MKIYLTLLLLSSLLYSSPDEIPQIVLDAIKNTECLKMSGVSESNFIRINRKKDVKKAKKHGHKLFRKHLILCSSPEECSVEANKLLKLGIKNIDLGPYQINYYYQNNRWKNEDSLKKYFIDEDAEERAREILWDLISRHGYSWQSIARYHHYNPKNKKRNRQYYSHLYEYVYGMSVPQSLLTE